MQGLKGHVVNGRLVVDQPTTLPEGTEVDLAIVEPPDDLDDEERKALHAALTRGWESARSGKTAPADDLLRKLRSSQ
ncbi:MAG TPA: hypothetical protein VGK30_09380 [Candidatus Binatia bacterium]|jgi:hypothetical protein